MKSKVVVAAAVFASVFMFPASAWAAPTFAPAASYGAGDGAQSMVVGDLNGDSNPDLATVNLNVNTVSVLLGNGDGTFADDVTYPTGISPWSLALGDLNGDLKPDLATANFNGVSVLLGNGDGTFAPTIDLLTGPANKSVAIGDLNGDGKSDIAAANSSTNNLSVFFGNGDGTFAPKVEHATGSHPNAVAVGDLNGDGKPDLLNTNVVSDTLSVFLSNGDGTFQPRTDQATGNSPASMAIGDLNSDGKLDITSGHVAESTFGVFLGNGDGTFQPRTDQATGSPTGSVAIGDIDGDGVVDVATANGTVDAVRMFLGSGDGSFDSGTDHTVGDLPASVVIGDLSGDSKTDLATANLFGDNVSVLLNTTPSPFTPGPTASISGTVRQGQTLTADEGTPDPTPDSFTYEWFADGVAIGGATAKTFELTSAEVGKKIKVTVTAIKAEYVDASDTSAETVAVEGIFTPGPTASISGQRRVGSTLTANTGSPSPTPDSFAYRWFLDGQQLGTKTKTLKLGAGTAGKPIRVKVYAIKAGYLTAADLSPATAPISNLQAKTISMELNDYTVVRGQRVYAEIELLAPNEPFSIVLDGTKIASGYANTKGVAIKAFTVPANATIGPRILRAYGKFTDRTDPDNITIR